MESFERILTLEELCAYVDNALDRNRRRVVEEELAKKPEVRRVVEAYRGQILKLRRLYDPILAEPVPDRLRALVHRRDNDLPGS